MHSPILHLLVSGHPADADRAGAARPGHGEADGGGDGQKVRLRGRLLLGLHLVVAEDQAQDMVHLRRAILILTRQGTECTDILDYSDTLG